MRGLSSSLFIITEVKNQYAVVNLYFVFRITTMFRDQIDSFFF